MSLTIEEIKALPRTEEGIFDLTGIGENLYASAGKVYPVYAAYETECNKKEGYPDIMDQMRVLNRKINEEFTFANASAFTESLLHTIVKISPEIYENYRELVDMFRDVVKRVLSEYYKEDTAEFASGSADETETFRNAVKEACDLDLLLKEKYNI